MLVVETIARIRREYFVKGKPIKEIVRDVKVSRNTVRKVIRSQATAFTYDRRVQPMPKLGPWTAELERMLEANETKSKRERLTRRCHVNHRVTSLWAPTPEIMQRSSLAATVSSRRRGIGGVFGGRPDGVGR